MNRLSIRMLGTFAVVLACVCMPGSARVQPDITPDLFEVWMPPPIGAQSPDFPLLPGESDEVSRAVGDVSTGYLVHARPLPRPHPTLSVLDVQAQRHLIYGTDEMISMLERAATAVQTRHPGAITYLGNIGALGGGDIRWSVSHNVGRDADLAFFVTDEAGKPAVMPDLLVLDDEGRYEGEQGIFLFDVPRNWSLIEGLIQAAGDQLQLIFVADWLRDKLLLYGRASGANPKTLARAKALMRQPRATLPHNDHFHVRLYCSPIDVASGCINNGVYQPWRNGHKQARQSARKQALLALKHERAEIRVAGVRRLGVLRAYTDKSEVIALLKDQSPAVRASAVRVLADFNMGGAELAQALNTERAAHVHVELIDALRRVGSSSSVKALMRQVQQGPDVLRIDPDLSVNARVLAAQALARTKSTRPVNTLILALESKDPALRKASAQALNMLTAQRFLTDWEGSSEAQQLSAVGQWRQWYASNRRKRLKQWVIAGITEAGFKVKSLDKRDVWSLCRAVLGPEHIRYNAQLALMKISGHNARSLDWTPEDANFYWRRWFERRQRRYRLPRIPPDLSTRDGYQKFLKQKKAKSKAVSSKSRRARKRARGGRVGRRGRRN